MNKKYILPLKTDILIQESMYYNYKSETAKIKSYDLKQYPNK